MSDRRRGALLTGLVLLSLALITVDYRSGEEGLVAVLQRGAMTVFAPVQDGLATVSRSVGRAVGTVAELNQLRRDNAALRDQVEELRQAMLTTGELERENAELRELLAMAERHGLSTVGARVIAEPAGDVGWSVLIDAGARQGLLRGQAVVNGDGLVGRVTDVVERYARVQLISSPDASYAVRVGEAEGLLRGQGPQPLQFEPLNPEARLEPGAEVVSQAFVGTAIPDGIPIGVLLERSDDSRFHPVRPYVGFDRLDVVQVVVDAPAPPEELDPAEIRTEEAGGRPPPPAAANGQAG